MKKLGNHRIEILLYLFFFSQVILAQEVTFQTFTGGPGDETYPRIINAGNNNFLILNRTLSNSFGNIDIMLTKIDSSGTPLWTSNIGNSSRNYSKTIHKTSDGFLVLSWHADNSKVDDWCLIKLDQNGNVTRHKFFGEDGIDEEVHYMLELANGNYVFAASIRSYTSYPMIAFLDKDLNFIRAQIFEAANRDHLVRGMVQTKKGDLVLCGSHNSKPFFLSVKEDGDFNFMRYINISGFSEVRQIIRSNENSMIAVGFTNSNTSGGYDILIIKLSNTGDIIWAKKYGDTGDDKAFDIKRKADNTFLISGETSSYGKSKDAFIVNIDQEGNFISGNLYGTEGMEQFGFFDFTDDQKIMLVTESNNTNSTSSDLLIVKADKDGNNCDSRIIESITLRNLTENLTPLYPTIVNDYRMEITHPFSTMTWDTYKSDLCTEEVPVDTVTPPVDTIPENYLSCKVKIANIITPNSDGIGDYVSAQYEKEIIHFEFKVYNISGAMLFKTNDPHFKWDGRIHGSTLPNGTYIYTCEYHCPDKQALSHDWGKIIITR